MRCQPFISSLQSSNRRVQKGSTGDMVEKGAAQTAENSRQKHPSFHLGPRLSGFGIGGGYERPYKRELVKTESLSPLRYGPLPHSGYYGSAEGGWRFRFGQATFGPEIELYKGQYGEETSK